jgi:hypothetical protein
MAVESRCGEQAVNDPAHMNHYEPFQREEAASTLFMDLHAPNLIASV